MPFVEESVEPGSVVVTDNWSGYDPLKKKANQRRIILKLLQPRVHLAISLLKRWMLGTHQSATSISDYYLTSSCASIGRSRGNTALAAGHGGGADAVPLDRRRLAKTL